jgi:DnaK suppressor protein
MDAIRKRLEQDLKGAVRRLRLAGGAAAIEEVTRAIGDASGFADEMDVIQANERREIEFATRELLVERVRRLSGALDRLKEGEYGICAECGETIAPARLRAMPEVETCVRCQDRIERFGRGLETIEAPAGVDVDDL